MAARKQSDTALQQLRAFGLALPGAHTKSPWPGHLDLAVRDKTFAYLGIDGEPFHISCKLPQSGQDALWLPFAKPTGYGLGKSGWVSAELKDDEPVPVDLFMCWIAESYRAQAPKKLLALLDADPPAPVSPKAVAKVARQASSSGLAKATVTALAKLPTKAPAKKSEKLPATATATATATAPARQTAKRKSSTAGKQSTPK